MNKIADKLITFFISKGIILLLRIKFIRALLHKIVESGAKKHYQTTNEITMPSRSKEDHLLLTRNIFHVINRGFERGFISIAYAKKFIHSLTLGWRPAASQWKNFKNQYGFKPPLFMVLSPTQVCNLACPGCYANSDKSHRVTLDFVTTMRILDEKKNLWGSHFTVISGGEPFMYRSGEKNIFDIFESFPDTMFLVYTNGTLIDEKTAKRLLQLGNVTPAISIEGYENETDGRRGNGIHKKILNAMENLRKAGVMFGISVTVTSRNVGLFIDDFDKFGNFYMDNQGASYMWMFQYMPIGRSHDTFEMVIPADKRKLLYDATWRIIRERGYFIVDFWYSGSLSAGCLAAGRSDGFIYIDWNGNVMPCAFNPYYSDNIHDVYKNGGNQNTVLFSPLMKKIRNWQNEYYFNQSSIKEKVNILASCPMRDHFRKAYDILKESNVRYSNPEAEAAFNDSRYYENMAKYGDDTRKYFDPIWKGDYVEPDK